MVDKLEPDPLVVIMGLPRFVVLLVEIRAFEQSLLLVLLALLLLKLHLHLPYHMITLFQLMLSLDQLLIERVNHRMKLQLNLFKLCVSGY